VQRQAKPTIVDAILPAKQDRSREKRDRLLRAGAETFALKGYDETRISDIAKAANLSVGTFYQRFKDKRTFFDALNEDFVLHASNEVELFFAEIDSDCTARLLLKSFVEMSRDFITQNVGYIRAMLTLAPREKGILDPLIVTDQLAADLLEAELLKRKLIKPGALRTGQVYFACGVMKKTLVVMTNNDSGPYFADDDKTIDELIEVMATYLSVKT